MRALVLLNLLNKLGERDKMRSLLSINYRFFTTSLINSIKQQFKNDRFYLSYDTEHNFEIKFLT